MANDLTDTVVMGPLIPWPEDQGESPVCNGTDCGLIKGRPSWTTKNGMSWCDGCGKPSQGYLKLCEICEEVYVYYVYKFTEYRIQDFNPTMPRVLPHAACAQALEEIENGAED